MLLCDNKNMFLHDIFHLQMKLEQLKAEFERSARMFNGRLTAFRGCNMIQRLVKALWEASLSPGAKARYQSKHTS